MRDLVVVGCGKADREVFIAWRVPSQEYGSEGTEPVHRADCGYFQRYGAEASCISGSGGSMCGGFLGGTAHYVYCTWGLFDDEESPLCHP